jgi:hypothetical protein
MWENLWQVYICHITTRIYRELTKLKSLKINDSMKKWAKELNRAFSKEESKWLFSSSILAIWWQKSNMFISQLKTYYLSCRQTYRKFTRHIEVSQKYSSGEWQYWANENKIKNRIHIVFVTIILWYSRTNRKILWK